MRELIACWQQTRMIVLIALCAALFVAVLIPFKLFTLVPGITEVRPASALPIVFSIFFGPAAAWGAAFGNIIGDFFGTISPGSIFGFVGNFIYGFVPYRLVRTFLKPEESIFSAKGWLVFLFSIVLGSGLCAAIIALGVDVLKIVPFKFLVHTIFLNNVVVSVLLAPLLIRALDKRIKQMRLGYNQLLDSSQISSPLLGGAGSIIVLLLLLAVYGLMMVPSWMQSIPLLSDHPNGFKIGASAVLPLAALILL